MTVATPKKQTRTNRELTLATIRIYKVAEVLGLPSQEVMALLRKEHGIEVKSASSTIEEIVARQFAERLARERQIDLPRGQLFGGWSNVRATTKKGRASKKASQEAAPLPKPKLGPPRLVKAAKAAKQALNAEAEAEAGTEVATEDATPPATSEAAPQAPAEVIEAPQPSPAEKPVVARPRVRRGLRIESESPAPVASPPVAAKPSVASPPVAAKPSVASPPVAAKPSVASPPVAAKPSVASPPVAAKPSVASPPVAAKPSAAKPVEAAPSVETGKPVEVAPSVETGNKPATPASPQIPSPAAPPTVQPQASAPTVVKRKGRFVPPTLRLRVEEPKPKPPRPTPSLRPPLAARSPGLAAPPLGGPRPLPSQPVRSPSARPLPARPAVGYRPPPRPYRSSGRRGARRPKIQTPVIPKAPPPITRTITLAEGMTVKDLADRLEVRAKDVLKKLMEKRLMVTINTTLDTENATMIAREFGADVQMRTFEEEMGHIEAEETNTADLVPRAPVVTVMGHVDHGKTTLLDAFRNTRVAEGEAGGITQHIGPYSVDVKGKRVVFLDTPGHEAFTMMRARGAGVTDVVILVVAADDGVMPQTQEAIDHARAANVPIIVAINKIDKSNANPERVKQELAERDLAPEDWGGQTVMVPVSAKKKENLETLLEMVLLVTEMGEHKANPQRVATGTVLEAKIDRGRGPVATVLVQDGTLKVGDNFLAGAVVGRVRALIDHTDKQVKSVGPSSPVEVLGLTGLPQPGDAFQAVADAAKARQIALLRQNQAKAKALGDRGSRLTLESLQEQLSEGGTKELRIIIKADVQGSAEVLSQTLAKLGDERVKILVVHAGVGAVSESDVLLASTSNAIIISFNVRPDRNAASMAEAEGVDIRKHSVIYHVTDEVKKAMAGMLEPTLREQQLGLAEVREVFKVPKFGAAAGCIVTDGRITRSGDAKVRLMRDNVVIHEGRIGSLRRFKDDVTEVKTGIECGIAFERYADLKVGDVIESFTVEKVAATV